MKTGTPQKRLMCHKVYITNGTNLENYCNNVHIMSHIPFAVTALAAPYTMLGEFTPRDPRERERL